MCGKICTKYADVMSHRMKFSRPGDRDLCTMTLNYPSVRKRKTTSAVQVPFLMSVLKMWWNSVINGTRMHTAHYSEFLNSNTSLHRPSLRSIWISLSLRSFGLQTDALRFYNNVHTFTSPLRAKGHAYLTLLDLINRQLGLVRSFFFLQLQCFATD